MTIRLRLALWYTGFLAAMFLLFAPAVHLMLERQLLLETDRWLAPLSEGVVQSVVGDGSLPGKAGDTPIAPQRPTGLPLPLETGPAEGPAGAGSSGGSASSYRDVDLERFTSPGVHLELLDPNGRVLSRSPNLEGRSIPVPDGAFASAWWGSPAAFTTSLDGTRYRGLLTPIPGGGEPRGFVLAARSLQETDGGLGTVRVFLLAGNAAGLLLAVAIGWLIARRGLRPIEEITQTARAIALSQGFGRRLEVTGSRDEVGQLAVTFNEMLASLDAAYAAQRRFVADASHELRSPLTSIRSNIDILRRAMHAPKEDRAEALSDVSAEVDRMTRLVSDLLLLARADAGHRIEMNRVALDELAKEAHRQAEARANGVVLGMGPMRRTLVLGNAVWLKQLLLILLDNALKYTPSGGSVSISLEREGELAVARVRDTGIGIAPEDLSHIFERFYRADKARARDEEGAGLGLAIARWIAEEHDGELTVESEPGKGSTFTLRLPVVGGKRPKTGD